MGLTANPATEAPQAVAVLAEALAGSIAASNFQSLHAAVHEANIQQARAVCQQALVDFPGGFIRRWLLN
jgi:hypothetical protein